MRVSEKTEIKHPDYGSAVIALLIGNLVQQDVLEALVHSSDEPILPEVKLNELRESLNESRKLMTRALKYAVPDILNEQ